MQKVVIIGGGIAGSTAARCLLRAGGFKVVIYERRGHIGSIGGNVDQGLKDKISGDPMFETSPQGMQAMGVEIHIETEVIDVDTNAKILILRDSLGRQFSDTYDKLILSMGSMASQFPIPGVNLKGVRCVKTDRSTKEAFSPVDINDRRKICIFGGSYIGVELAEAYRESGNEVLLIESSSHILGGQFDRDNALRAEEVLKNLGVEVEHSRVQRFVGDDSGVRQVVTSQKTHDAKLVLLNIGFYPVASLCPRAERAENSAYKVNFQQRTSIPDVYAIGDCCASERMCCREYRTSYLASNAVRSATIAACHIIGRKIDLTFALDTSLVKIGSLYMASTGSTEAVAKENDIDVNVADFTAKQFPPFMAVDNHDVSLRLVYRRSDRVLVGAQMVSEYDISEHIGYYAVAVQRGITVNRLAFADTFFMPHFNQHYNYHMLCALGAP